MIVNIRFRHLQRFPRDLAKHRKRAPFRKGIDDTMGRLEYELEKLGATAAYIQVAVSETEILKDGSRPYANARPQHPGVVVIADTKQHGQLTWAADSCTDWLDNLRAIAVTMERLRLADLYDVMKGAQYRGFAALPPAGGTITAGPARSMEWAAGVIHRHVGRFYSKDDILAGGDVMHRAIQQARRQAHPDQGGTAAEFAEVEEAKKILGG